MSLPEQFCYRSITECVQFQDDAFDADYVFDFGPYFLSHKWSEDFGMHIQVCSIDF